MFRHIRAIPKEFQVIAKTSETLRPSTNPAQYVFRTRNNTIQITYRFCHDCQILDVCTQFAFQYCVSACHLPTHIIPKHHQCNYTIILDNAAIPPQNSYIEKWIVFNFGRCINLNKIFAILTFICLIFYIWVCISGLLIYAVSCIFAFTFVLNLSSLIMVRRAETSNRLITEN